MSIRRACKEDVIVIKVRSGKFWEEWSYQSKD